MSAAFASRYAFTRPLRRHARSAATETRSEAADIDEGERAAAASGALFDLGGVDRREYLSRLMALDGGVNIPARTRAGADTKSDTRSDTKSETKSGAVTVTAAVEPLAVRAMTTPGEVKSSGEHVATVFHYNIDAEAISSESAFATAPDGTPATPEAPTYAHVYVYRRNVLAEAEKQLIAAPLIRIVVAYTNVELFYAQCPAMVERYESDFWDKRLLTNELTAPVLHELARTGYACFARPFRFCAAHFHNHADRIRLLQQACLIDAISFGQLDLVKALLPHDEEPSFRVLTAALRYGPTYPDMYRYFASKYCDNLIALQAHLQQNANIPDDGGDRKSLRQYNEQITALYMDHLKTQTAKEQRSARNGGPQQQQQQQQQQQRPGGQSERKIVGRDPSTSSSSSSPSSPASLSSSSDCKSSEADTVTGTGAGTDIGTGTSASAVGSQPRLTQSSSGKPVAKRSRHRQDQQTGGFTGRRLVL